CGADVDGTSLDTLEAVAVEHGLDAEQVLVPQDHLLLPAARCLPAILVVRAAEDLPHFVLLWRRHGPLLQIMDPAVGRLWLSARRLRAQLYLHSATVPAAAWSSWARSPDFLAPLAVRFAALGFARRASQPLLAAACADPGWLALAACDASLRLARRLVAAGALRRGGAASAAFSALFQRCLAAHSPAASPVAPELWTVDPVAPDRLRVRGALLVRALGVTPAAAAARAVRSSRAAATPPPEPPEAPEEHCARSASFPPRAGCRPRAARRARPCPWLVDLWRACGPLSLSRPALLLAAAAAAAAITVVEPLFLARLLFAWQGGAPRLERTAAAAALLALLAASLLIELALASGARGLGRQLEIRFRIRLLRGLPRVPESFFRTRLAADLADRAHGCHRLRLLPEQSAAGLRTALELLLTCLGIAALDRDSALFAAAALAALLGAPLPLLQLLQGRELRHRSSAAAWSALFLDTLRGLSPIRAHSAASTFERLHDRLLAAAARAQASFLAAQLWLEVTLYTIAALAAAALLGRHLARHGFDGSELVLVYWALSLSLLAPRWSALWSAQLPAWRNLVRRLLEPLAAVDEGLPAASLGEAAAAGVMPASSLPSSGVMHASSLPSSGVMHAPSPPPSTSAAGAAPFLPPRGVALRFRGVAVRAAGTLVLSGVDLAIAASEHLAVVGPSGAGKSTLLALLLGSRRPAAGAVLADGEPLAGLAALAALRAATAWVDPQVRLWHRPLLANLLFGSASPHLAAARLDLGAALREADLLPLLDRLPEGLAEQLGEGGSRLAGGERQRVRLGRAFLRRAVRLVILDEPFCGLEPHRRLRLLRRARARWRHATLLYVTHQVREAAGFPRVLVVERGAVVEDAPPAALAAHPGSRFAQLLAAEQAGRALWTDPLWRRLHLPGAAGSRQFLLGSRRGPAPELAPADGGAGRQSRGRRHSPPADRTATLSAGRSCPPESPP
ncbi:MAG TPA: ATP-binding cassette domain-containing protein, partial [Thermoanaerobaculia bacterium]|nr:ATP-binding cassette domain-containing protein [Thermoanaerobaculia bacterium]